MNQNEELQCPSYVKDLSKRIKPDLKLTTFSAGQPVNSNRARQHKPSKEEKSRHRKKLAFGIISSVLIVAFLYGVAYTETKNEMIVEDGGEISHGYRDSNYTVELNAPEPTFEEVNERMFGGK